MSPESAGPGQGCTFRFHIRAAVVAGRSRPRLATAKAMIDPQLAARHPAAHPAETTPALEARPACWFRWPHGRRRRQRAAGARAWRKTYDLR